MAEDLCKAQGHTGSSLQAKDASIRSRVDEVSDKHVPSGVVTSLFDYLCQASLALPVT